MIDRMLIKNGILILLCVCGMASGCDSAANARGKSNNGAGAQTSAGLGPGKYKTMHMNESIDDFDVGTNVVVEYYLDKSERGTRIECVSDGSNLDAWSIAGYKGQLRIYPSASFPRTSQGKSPELRVKVWSGVPVRNVNLHTTGSFIMPDAYKASQSLTLSGDGATSFTFKSIELTGSSELVLSLNGAASASVGDISVAALKAGASGATNFTVAHLTGGNVTLVSNGASNIKVGNLRVNTLSAQSCGASFLGVGGVAKVATLTAQGVAKLDAADLEANRFSLSEDSMSTITVSGRTDVKKNNQVLNNVKTVIYDGDEEVIETSSSSNSNINETIPVP